MKLTGEIPDYVCSFPVVLFKIHNKNHVSGIFYSAIVSRECSCPYEQIE